MTSGGSFLSQDTLSASVTPHPLLPFLPLDKLVLLLGKGDCMRGIIGLFFIAALLSGSVVQAKEFCFGSVGKQCATPDKIKGKKPSPLNIPACSKIEKGKTNCWVSPGSIAHDNCCAKNPHGVMCANETKHDGKCAKEWEAAFQDIKKKQAWYHIYKVKEPAPLSFVSSERMKKFGGQESKTTAGLCAPGGTKLLALHDSGFCCSEKAKRQGNLMICAQESVAQGLAPSKKASQLQKQSQDFLKKTTDTLAKLDQLLKAKGVSAERRPQTAVSSEPVSKKTQKQMEALKNLPPEKRWPELSAEEMIKAKKLEKQAGEFEQKAKTYEQEAIAQMPKQTAGPAGKQQIAMKPQPAIAPPPPLTPLPQQYRKPAPTPEPMASKPKQEPTEEDHGQGTTDNGPASAPSELRRGEPTAEEPEVARQEPEPQEEAQPQCERGTWSPTFGRCVEEEAPQEVAKPDCPAGTHWSPTLQSCQAD